MRNFKNRKFTQAGGGEGEMGRRGGGGELVKNCMVPCRARQAYGPEILIDMSTFDTKGSVQ